MATRREIFGKVIELLNNKKESHHADEDEETFFIKGIFPNEVSEAIINICHSYGISVIEENNTYSIKKDKFEENLIVATMSELKSDTQTKVTTWAGELQSESFKNEGFSESWQAVAEKAEADKEVLTVFRLPQKSTGLIEEIQSIIEAYKESKK